MASHTGDGQRDSSTDAGRLQKSKRRRTNTTAVETSSNDQFNPDVDTISRQRATSGSSRDTMIGSSTPPTTAGKIKYTRTGRVSKAFKGERVHGCDECGKVYTRAEHLRRHKKNHSPGSLPCDVPGCGRLFFREDLLLRHKQKHSEEHSPLRHHSSDSQAPDSMAASSMTYGSETASSYTTGVTGVDASTSMLLPSQNHNRRTSASSTAGNGPAKYSYEPRSVNDMSRSSSIASMKGMGYKPFQGWPARSNGPISISASYVQPPIINEVQWHPPSPPQLRYSSPSGNCSPRQPYYPNAEPSGRNSVDSSLLDHHGGYTLARSPIPAESGLPMITTSGEESWNNTFATISTPSSEVSHDPRRSSGHTRKISGIAVQLSSPEERDLMEQMDLQTPTIGMTSPDFGPHMDLSVFDSEQRYITAYWQAVHSIWPFVHRSSFDFTSASPLLRAAMITLGAQSTGDTTDLSNARILHERCLKVLKKRTNSSSHSYRICDMQAIVLVEIYSLFKSRRPPLQPSPCYEDVFRQLVNDPQAYPSTELNLSIQQEYDLSNAAIEMQREAKLRLLIACYVLERQHSVFFGRKTSHCLSVPGEQLPFPQPLSSWDADLLHGPAYPPTCDQTRYDYTYQVLNMVPQLHPGQQPLPHDIFRSMHLIACLDDVDEGHMLSTWKPIDDIEASALLTTLDQSPRTRLAYHMFSLCKKSPVRDLLAVAGESWVMAEKITNQAEYSAAQLEAGNWARAMHDSSNQTHRNALCHALRIIDIHRTSARTGLLFQDWALYMATLVVWITSYMQCGSGPRRRIGGSNTPPTAHELEKTVIAVTEAGSSIPIIWRDACSILLWSKSKLDQVNIPHNCGLTNGALDVLEKLINRGHEDTWLC